MISEIIIACMITSFLTASVVLLFEEILNMRSNIKDVTERFEEGEDDILTLNEKIEELERFVAESLKPPEYNK